MKNFRYIKYVPSVLLVIVFAVVMIKFFNPNRSWSDTYKEYASVMDTSVLEAKEVKKVKENLQVPSSFVAIPKDNQIQLKWEPVKGVTGYDLEIDGKIIECIYKTEYVHDKLELYAKHQYRVRSRKLDAVSPWSGAITCETVEKQINSIDIQLDAIVYGSNIIITWDAIKDATSYTLEIDGKLIENLTAENQKGIYVHENVSETQHTYKLKVNFADKNGEWSSIITASKSVESVQETIMYIQVDGDLKEWTDKTIVAEEQAIESRLYCTQDEKNIYIGLKTEQMANLGAFYLDIDENPNTGYKMESWSYSGCDVLIDGNSLYIYQGKGEDWSWKRLGELKIAQTDKAIEIVIDKMTINKSGIYPLRVGFSIQDKVSIPMSGSELAKSYTQAFFDESILKAPQGLKAEASTSAAYLTWEPVEYASGYEIEVNGKNPIATKETFYKHIGLSSGQKQSYRVRTIIDDEKGPWSTGVDAVPIEIKGVSAFIQLDGKVEDWNKIGGIDKQRDGSFFKVIQDETKIYCLISSDKVQNQVTIFLDTDCNNKTGYEEAGWKLSGADYMIDGLSLYAYKGDGKAWSWQYQCEVKRIVENNILELSIESNKMNLVKDRSIEAGVVIDDTFYMPSKSEYMFATSQIAKFEPDLLKPPTSNAGTTVKSIQIEWEQIANAEGYDIEIDGRLYTGLTATNFKVAGLEAYSLHKYRLRTNMGGYTGAWSEYRSVYTKKSATTSTKAIMVDGGSDDWTSIKPLVVGNSEDYKLYGVLDNTKLYIYINRIKTTETGTIYLDVDGLTQTGYKETDWSDAGIDYIIEDGFLYKYTGDGKSWSWELKIELNYYIESSQAIELSLGLEHLGLKQLDAVYVGYSSDNVSMPTKQNSLTEVNQVLAQ